MVDGERVCARCGRAWSVEMASLESAQAYRDVPVVELVPVEEEPPERGVEIVCRGERCLDARVGGACLIPNTVGRVFASYLASFVALPAVVLAALVYRLSFPSLVGILTAVLAPLYWVTAPLAAESERVRVAGRRLLVARGIRSDAPTVQREIDLDEVVGVHDERGCVRLELQGGRALTIGEGLDVPPDVLRWLARRLAHLVPPVEDKLA